MVMLLPPTPPPPHPPLHSLPRPQLAWINIDNLLYYYLEQYIKETVDNITPVDICEALVGV